MSWAFGPPLCMKMAALVEASTAGRSGLQVIVGGDCLEVAHFSEDSDPAAKIRPALGNGTTFCRTPLPGEGHMAVSVTDHRRSNRLSKEAPWICR
jgi:hypothetical protein